MKKLIFIFIASICLIENSNAATTTIFCPKALRQNCVYDYYTTPDETTCSDSKCELCKNETSVTVNNGVKQTSTRIFYQNCPNQEGRYTCECETSTTYECAPGFYGTATLTATLELTGCTECPDNALCRGGNNSTFDCVSGYTKNTTLNICEKEGLTCSNNQFIYNGKCYDCPRTGGCDGVNLTCNDGFIQEGPNCICKNGYIDSSLKCKKCPANASCDGSETFSCNQSFYKTNNTCTQCPHNGTTEGGGKTNLSECYLPAGQYVNDAGYFVIDDEDTKCHATNK